MKLWWAALLVALACGPPSDEVMAHLPSPEDEPAELYIIRMSIAYATYMEWRASPWSRPYDGIMETPVYVLVDNRGMGCVVPASVWHLNPQYITKCVSGWLIPRPK